MQDAGQDQPGRLTGPDQFVNHWVSQQPRRALWVRLDRRDARAGQQRLRVPDHHNVVVRVHDAARPVDRLCGLVRVARGRQPGANVKELPDALLREPSHRIAKDSRFSRASRAIGG